MRVSVFVGGFLGLVLRFRITLFIGVLVIRIDI